MTTREEWVERLAWDIALREGGSIHPAREKAHRLVDENPAFFDEMEQRERDLQEIIEKLRSAWGGANWEEVANAVAAMADAMNAISEAWFGKWHPPTRWERFGSWMWNFWLERRWL